MTLCINMKSSETIPLEFTKANALLVLSHGANPSNSPYSHKQIAEWCDKFWCQYLDADAPQEIERLLAILTSVETQWDLFLANTYSIEQLQAESFEHVQLPTEWFSEWLNEANA